MTVTQKGKHKPDNVNIALSGKRNTQTLRLFHQVLVYPENRKHLPVWQATVKSRQLVTTQIFDPSKHTHSDVLNWIAIADKPYLQMVAELDGNDFLLCETINWGESDAWFIRKTIHCCGRCNRLFFNTTRDLYLGHRPDEYIECESRTNRTFCSDECRQQYNQTKHSQLRKEARLGAKVTFKKQCQQCGCEFEAKRKSAAFCSTKCRVYAHRNRNRGAS